MVNPEPVVGLGLQVGGAVAKNAGHNAAERARNEALEEALARQAGYQREADQSLAGAMAQFTNPRAGYEGAAKRREAYVTSAITDNGDGMPMAGSTPDSVRKDLAKRLGDALVRGRQEAAAKARLGVTGDQSRDYFDALRESGTRLSMLRDFSRGSSALVQMAMEVANMRAQPYMNIADLLSGAGSITSAYGMMQAPKAPVAPKGG